MQFNGKMWQNIFRIAAADATFDARHTEHIDAYLNIHQHRITPHQATDTNRLSNVFHTRERQTEEILTQIRRMKNTAPRSSTITKEILEKCPPSTVSQLTHIFNASARDFPKYFKQTTITFIPQDKQPPTTSI